MMNLRIHVDVVCMICMYCKDIDINIYNCMFKQYLFDIK